MGFHQSPRAGARAAVREGPLGMNGAGSGLHSAIYRREFAADSLQMAGRATIGSIHDCSAPSGSGALRTAGGKSPSLPFEWGESRVSAIGLGSGTPASLGSADLGGSRRSTLMEFGMFHEFPSLPGRTES